MAKVKRSLFDTPLKVLLLASALLTVFTTFLVTFLLTKEGLSFFSQVSFFDFITGTRWAPLLEPKSFGVLPLVIGTFHIVVESLLFAVPLGVLIGVYLSEYASKNVRNIVKPSLEVLAGIPTVVYGYLALTFVTPILKTFFPQTEIFNAASAAIVVGIMVLPMISSLVDDALRGVPSYLRQGGYALGATSFEVTTKILLPSVFSRVGAAVILAFSRALGETMAVTLAAGSSPSMSLNPLKGVQTMTAYIVQVSLGDTPAGGVEYLTCFAVALLLFVMTFTLNFLGAKLIYKERY